MTNIAFNEDCLTAMKQMPDKAFDLAVVDPPYGSGLDGGGNPNRFGQRFDRYKVTGGVIRDTLPTESEKDAVCRTGGTWAAKYAKKSLRGM